MSTETSGLTQRNVSLTFTGVLHVQMNPTVAQTVANELYSLVNSTVIEYTVWHATVKPNKSYNT